MNRITETHFTIDHKNENTIFGGFLYFCEKEVENKTTTKR